MAVADPRPEAAAALAGTFGARSFTDAGALISDEEVDAVVVTATSEAHADLVVAAAAGRQAGVLSRSRWRMTLADADRALGGRRAQAGMTLQVGFNRTVRARLRGGPRRRRGGRRRARRS